jgi:hypothetical protein
MTVEQQRDSIREGQERYHHWADSLVADEEGRRLYGHEAAKKELWLALVEARQAAGLTQAQVACIEKRGYDAYTLNTLRRYVKALGDDFSLQVTVQRRSDTGEQAPPLPVRP